MILGQRYAIQSGTEILSERVFRHVAHTKMKLLEPALAALRSHDPEKMRKFDDLLPTDLQLAEMMAESPQWSQARLELLSLAQSQAGKSKQRSTPEPVPQPVTITEETTVTSFAASIAGHEQPLQVLRDAKWLLDDPFEFAPAYRRA
jgi:hypothetical protein